MLRIAMGIGATLFAVVVLLTVFGIQTTQNSSRSVDEGQRNAPVALPTLSSGNHDGFCRDKWSKRGELDNQMYSHCLKQEDEGFFNLQTLVQQHSAVPYLSVVVESAIKKWTSNGQRQDTMVHHTVKQEIEGYLDMRYEVGQPSFDKGKATACERKWGVQYQRAFPEFCVRGHHDA